MYFGPGGAVAGVPGLDENGDFGGGSDDPDVCLRKEPFSERD